jgi:hypothetical protein
MMTLLSLLTFNESMRGAQQMCTDQWLLGSTESVVRERLDNQRHVGQQPRRLGSLHHAVQGLQCVDLPLDIDLRARVCVCI